MHEGGNSERRAVLWAIAQGVEELERFKDAFKRSPDHLEDLRAFIALGRRYWADGDDIQPREAIVRKTLEEGFGQ